MNIYLKFIIICALVSFFATLFFAAITTKHVSYSPGISSNEMDSMSYSEVVKIKHKRKIIEPFHKTILSSVQSTWFWIEFFKMWSLLFASGFLSFYLFNKWGNKNAI